LYTRRGRAPERDPAVTAVVVVVVAERPFVSDEEARSAMAESFVHLGKCEGDLAYPIEFRFSHAGQSCTAK
jgi:hypothetical protein